MITDILEALVRKVQADTTRQAQSGEIDNARVISCEALFRPWMPGKYTAGDICTYNGQVYKCAEPGHVSTWNPDWTPEAYRALWIPYHSTSAKWAKPYIQPEGAHDMYKAGEYMVYTDGKTYLAKEDTSYSPEEYPQAWEEAKKLAEEAQPKQAAGFFEEE